MCVKMYSLRCCLGYNTLIIYLIFFATCNCRIPYDISKKPSIARNSTETINEQVDSDAVLDIKGLLEDFVKDQKITVTTRDQMSDGKQPQTTLKPDVGKSTVTSKLSTLLIPGTSPRTTSSNTVSTGATQSTTNTATPSPSATTATTAAKTTNNKVHEEYFPSEPQLTTNSTTSMKPVTTSSDTPLTDTVPTTHKTRTKKELTTTMETPTQQDSQELLARCKFMRMTGFPLPPACSTLKSDFWV